MGGDLPGAVWIRGADVAEATEPRLVGAAQRLTAREIEGTQRVAVVAPPPGDDDGPVGLAACQVVAPHQLQTALDRLGTAAYRVDRRVRHGEVRSYRAGVRLQRLVREGRAVDVREGSSLALHRVHDGLPAVADVDDDRAAGGVQVGPPRGIPDGAALGAHRDRQIAAQYPLEDPAGGHAAPIRAIGRTHIRIVGRPAFRAGGAASPAANSRQFRPKGGLDVTFGIWSYARFSPIHISA